MTQIQTTTHMVQKRELSDPHQESRAMKFLRFLQEEEEIHGRDGVRDMNAWFCETRVRASGQHAWFREARVEAVERDRGTASTEVQGDRVSEATGTTDTPNEKPVDSVSPHTLPLGEGPTPP